VKIPKGFFPQQDTGRLQGSIVGGSTFSYQALLEKAEMVEEQVHHDPDVETVTMVAGTSGGGFGATRLRLTFNLSRPGSANRLPDQVVARLRRKTSGVPGATMFLQNSQDVRIEDGRRTRISVHPASAGLRLAVDVGSEGSR